MSSELDLLDINVSPVKTERAAPAATGTTIISQYRDYIVIAIVIVVAIVAMYALYRMWYPSEQAEAPDRNADPKTPSREELASLAKYAPKESYAASRVFEAPPRKPDKFAEERANYAAPIGGSGADARPSSKVERPGEPAAHIVVETFTIEARDNVATDDVQSGPTIERVDDEPADQLPAAGSGKNICGAICANGQPCQKRVTPGSLCKRHSTK